MANKRFTVDRPFAEQSTAREILKHSSSSKYPVPKATLLKIHRLAKEIIAEELNPEKEIVGLRLGCYTPLVESEEVEEPYFVGKLPTTDKDDSDTEILSSEFVFPLLQRIREEIIRQTPPIALESGTLHIDFSFAVKIISDADPIVSSVRFCINIATGKRCRSQKNSNPCKCIEDQ